MTTIAYDGKTIASDSQTTSNFHGIKTFGSKVRVMKDGGIYFLSGLVPATEVFIETFSYLKSSNPLVKNVKLLYLYPCKTKVVIRTITDGTFVEYPPNVPYALGSGAKIALAIMNMGLPAARAVEEASKVDASTGGKIEVITLNDLNATKEKVSKNKSKIRR